MSSLLLTIVLLVGVASAVVLENDPHDFGSGSASGRGSGDSGSGYQLSELTASGFLDSVLAGGDRGVQNVPLEMASAPDTVLHLLPFLGLHEMYHIASRVGLKAFLKDSPFDAITLFAPTDSAIRKWRDSVPAGSEHDVELMTKLCKTWIVPYPIKSAEFANNKKLPTILEAPEMNLRLNIYNERKNMTINGAPISTLVDFTINGNVVHAIAKVPYPLPVGNIFVNLAQVGYFWKLFKLVEIAELQDALATIDPLTVFAPCNKAFDLVPERSLAELKNNITKLQYVLKSHLSRGAYYSAGIKGDADSVESLTGQRIRINIENGNLLLNKPSDKSAQAPAAKIISRDVPATNGVVHVIDKLLVPIPL